MFLYCPAKGTSRGHAIAEGPGRMTFPEFIDAYFERVDPQKPMALVTWKSSVLPKLDWAEAYLGPKNENIRQILFTVEGEQVMFFMGIVFPLSTADPALFEFLRRFSASAPFKMSAKNFMVGVVAGNSKFAWRKPEGEAARKLEEFIR